MTISIPSIRPSRTEEEYVDAAQTFIAADIDRTFREAVFSDPGLLVRERLRTPLRVGELGRIESDNTLTAAQVLPSGTYYSELDDTVTAAQVQAAARSHAPGTYYSESNDTIRMEFSNPEMLETMFTTSPAASERSSDILSGTYPNSLSTPVFTSSTFTRQNGVGATWSFNPSTTVTPEGLHLFSVSRDAVNTRPLDTFIDVKTGETVSHDVLYEEFVRRLAENIIIENSIEVFGGKLSLITTLKLTLPDGEVLPVQSLPEIINLEDLQ